MPTQTTPASIDLDARTVSRTVRVAAPPGAVWRALTEPAHVAGWFGDACETDDGGPFRLGGRGRLHFEGYGWSKFEVTRLEEGRVVALRWGQVLDAPDDGTEALFTLTPDDDGTRLDLVESGFTGADDEAVKAALDGNRGGWDAELDELVAYVESTSW